jgi:putative peptidoglycan lipid II flippase
VDVEQEKKLITHDPANPVDRSTTTIVTADPSTTPPPEQAEGELIPRHRRHWGDRTFRFSLDSFRLGNNISLRRFSITEAALLLAMAYLTSKGLGVIRQSLFNAIFGTGPDATAYYAAFSLPDTLFNLIAGGALSSAFIPVFIRYEQRQGEHEAWRLASLVLNVLLVGLTLVILVAEFLAPQFVNRLLVPGLPPYERAMTTTLTRIMLLHPLILGLGTVATAVLKSKQQFLLPAVSIAIYDVGLIAGLLVTLAFPHVGIYGPTFGLLVSAFLQVGVLIPALRRQGVRYSFFWNLKYPGLREVLALLIPNLLALGIASVTNIVDTAFASYLPDHASIAAIRNASLLYGLPSVLLASTVGQALLPQITTQAARGRYLRMRNTILKIGGGAVLLSVPAALVLYLLGKPAIHILFQHGAFTAHSSALTSTALLGYAIGLPAVTADTLLIVCFYALKDARTPLFMNIVVLALHILLLTILVKVFTGPHAILGILVPGAITGAIEAALLYLILFMRLRRKVKTDKGAQRLYKRRLQPAEQAKRVGPPHM